MTEALNPMPIPLAWKAARVTALAIAAMATALSASSVVHADRIENKVAVFSALDKVTATIKKIEIPLNETIEYGALKITPRVCYSRPPTEKPKTTTFVEVDEVQLDGQVKRVFAGWMFAESPGLNAVEHPVFDVWLTDCQKPANTIAAKRTSPAVEGEPAAEPGAEELPRRRVRR